MFARFPLVLLGSLVVAIAAIPIFTEFVSPQLNRHFEPLVLELNPQPAVVIQHVRVLDLNSGQVSPPSSVMMIKAIRTEPVPSSHLKDHTVFDGEGGVLMPSLTDFHVHIGFSNGEPPWTASIFHPVNPAQEKESYIYAGVTTVVEGSVNPLPHILSGRETSSPHIFKTGKQVTALGGHPHPMINALIPWPMNKYISDKLTVQVEDFATQEESIRDVLEDPSVHHLKIIYDNAIPTDSPKLSLDSLRLAIELAHAYGKPAYVHVGSVQDAMEAVRAGADLLMHVPFVDTFSGEQIKELAESGAVFVTTGQIWSWASLGFDKSRELTRLEKTLMPPRTYEAFTQSWADVFKTFKLPHFTQEYLSEKVSQFIHNIDTNIQRLHEGGVTLVAGTDTGVPGLVPGASLQYELRHLVSLGLPTTEVLRSATVTPGKLLAENEYTFGEVKPGNRAELIVVKENPLENVSYLEDISYIFTQGKVYQRETIP